ncbi:MAG: hypothetical protein ABUR63_01615 [Verrucomicrobiota bacterium]
MPAREDQKKHDEEMLIVHKAGAKPDPKKVGGPVAALPRAPSLDKQELDLIKKQIGVAKDPGLRRDLLSQISTKFGNDKAIEVVRELRLKDPGDDLLASPPGGPKAGESKAGGATDRRKGKA